MDERNYHGLAQLMTRIYHGEDLTALGQQLIQRSTEAGQEGAAEALLDLAVLLHLKGFHEMAREVQRQGLGKRQNFVLPAQQGAVGIRLLALMVPGELNANTPLEFLVENTDIELQQLFIGKDLPFPEEIPEHDVAFVAVGESEETLPLLGALSQALVHWPRPVINHPHAIARLARDRLGELLLGVEGLLLPPTARFSRHDLTSEWGGGPDSLGEGRWQGYPVIVRPVDSHAGRGLRKIDGADQWSDYLAEQREAEFFVSPFVDYRSVDGAYRKYRIAVIEGVPLASHLAISDHWMVHYLNGGMAESAAKRAEEARFMENFEQDFAHRHRGTWQQLSQRLGLDYVVLDCAETRAGELLLFEADSSAVVHAMDPVMMFPYKQPAMAKVFAAFRCLLEHARKRPAGLLA